MLCIYQNLDNVYSKVQNTSKKIILSKDKYIAEAKLKVTCASYRV